ncbi:T9SS type A sorting domain-containing protein [Thalassobellus sediminis]|uniref:T9SS type A sorting domain-containing protein n=1 Tax=Thalassobellus sediminis TaxID=3367753 RepID=UPI0037AA5E1B
MKKIYLFLMIVLTLSFVGSAQIYEDDFESYISGNLGLQNPTLWSTWLGIPDNNQSIIVVNDIAIGDQSGYIGPGDITDAMLLLGNRTSGDYHLVFDMYISSGSTAYFNVQGETEDPGTGCQGAGFTNGVIGIFNAGEIFFNQDGVAPGIVINSDVDGGVLGTSTYPEDNWFPVVFYFDLDALTYVLTINGTDLNSTPIPFQFDATLGAIDFFSVGDNNSYWIDNIVFDSGPLLSADELTTNNFSVFPNPVSDVLNIRSATSVDKIEVYNLLGKLVFSTTPKNISPNIDMSSLYSGMYLVKIIIGDTSKTVKVIKSL